MCGHTHTYTQCCVQAQVQRKQKVAYKRGLKTAGKSVHVHLHTASSCVSASEGYVCGFMWCVLLCVVCSMCVVCVQCVPECFG